MSFFFYQYTSLSFNKYIIKYSKYFSKNSNYFNFILLKYLNRDIFTLWYKNSITYKI